MVFSSQLFLFFFLPVTLLLYYPVKNRGYRNYVLMVMSLFFYWYGVRSFILVMILSVFVNYFFTRVMENAEGNKRKLILIALLIWDLAILFYYKYWDFAVETLGDLTGEEFNLRGIIVPVGLSFVTFQAMSYVIDVYKKTTAAEKNPFNVALYICLFPQLVAGPIVKYHDVQDQIVSRNETFEMMNEGAVRFIYGLGKKVMIANVLGNFVDDIFAMDPNTISMATAWIGSIGYTLQIYFDFSGYSDMAIGLGKMFGFSFKENFDHPYSSASVSEFWRKWHISLGRWFREYVYIPLGGNRNGTGATVRNLMIVWLLTGIWHGANWTFIAWGVAYGVIITIEKLSGFSGEKKHAVIGSIYTLLAVDLLWVVFRSDSIGGAIRYIGAMFGANGVISDNYAMFTLQDNLLLLIVGAVLSTGIYKWVMTKEFCSKRKWIIEPLLCVVILIISISYIVKGSYDPFIYFNF